ncbi:MAG: hypothetical protein HDT19_07135 [Oscillibacter sp.]|nr:hypothetical protein [Oscillibacter sp.]
MRINETYERTPIQPYQPEDQSGGCNKVGTQSVDIAASLSLSPTAAMGTPTVSCQGNPSVTCVTDPDGTCCTLTFIQQVCVSVPIRYGVTMSTGEPSISCADDECGCNCGCGC